MEHLFNLKRNQTISKVIRSLSKRQFSQFSYDKIIERGYEYFNAGAVYPNVDIQLGKFELEVSGSYGEYEVLIEQDKDAVYGYCDCPYDGGVCKHIIASLLYLQNHVSEERLKAANITKAILAKQERTKNNFEKYVNQLSIEELRQLVLDFAPKHFRTTIKLEQEIKKGHTARVEKQYETATIAIHSLFEREWHYNISKFETAVTNALEKLRPFWTVFPQYIAAELVDFIQNVATIFEDGQLYDEYGNSYEGEAAAKYIAEFIAAISEEDQVIASQKIGQVYRDLEYDVFDNFHQELTKLMPDGIWRKYF